jgi:hypothetical protein
VDWEFASVAVTVSVNEPVPVGDPEIRPVLLFKSKPAGRAPEVTAYEEIATLPDPFEAPVAVSCKE